MGKYIASLSTLLLVATAHASPTPMRDSIVAARDQLAAQAKAYRETRAVKISQLALKAQVMGGFKIAKGVATIRHDGTQRSQKVTSVGINGGIGQIAAFGVQQTVYRLSDRRVRSGKPVPAFDVGLSMGVGLVLGVEGNISPHSGTLQFFGAGANFGTLELTTNFRGALTPARTIPGLRVADKALVLAERALHAYDVGDLKAAEIALPRLQRAASRIANDQKWFDDGGL
jgi:hypothetical protein